MRCALRDHVPLPVLRPRGHRGAGRARVLPGKPLGGLVPKQVQGLLHSVRTFRHFTFLSFSEDGTARGGRTGRGGGDGGCRASGFVPRASPGLTGFGVGGGGGLDACAMGMGGRCRFLRAWCWSHPPLLRTMAPHSMPRTHALRSVCGGGDLGVWAMGKQTSRSHEALPLT